MQTTPSQFKGVTTAGPVIWRPDDGHDLQALATSIQQKRGLDTYHPEFLDAIDAFIDGMSDELRELSINIHGERTFEINM